MVFNKCTVLVMLMLTLMLTGCSKGGEVSATYSTESSSQESKQIDLELAMYSVGGLGDPQVFSALLTDFHNAYPNINVTVTYLDYDTGDSVIEGRINNGNVPDIIFEGPERLVADFGKRGLMMDLSDIIVEDDIQDNILKACSDAGNYYEYPVCITTHCMAVNRDIFEEAGCLEYLNEDTRIWSTDQFIEVINKLYKYGYDTCVEVYCSNQAGDQGTRALVNNLYNGSFTDLDHTVYTVNSEENIAALDLLQSLRGIDFNENISGVEAVNHFVSSEVPIVLCWNVSLESSKTMSGELGFDVLPMMFPINNGLPELPGGIWGFGIFNTGDKERIDAAKTFIKFMTSGKQYEELVLKSSFMPARKINNIYVNDDLMAEYQIFTDYMGDYYQVTDNWTQARKAWWQLLQKVGEGSDVKESCEWFQEQVEVD